MSKTAQIVQISVPFYTRAYEYRKGEAKAGVIKAAERGYVNLVEISGDEIEEEPSKVTLDKAIGFSIQLKSGLAQILFQGADPEDDSQDAADATEETKLCLYNMAEIAGGWVVGKLKRQLNGVQVDNPDYIILRSSKFDSLPMTNENFVDANMDWITETIFSDYEDAHGVDEETEEFDDGE